MKAAIWHGGRDMRIEEVERPKAGDDGMVIKVRAAGICGSDLHLHRYSLDEIAPYITGIALGHEYSGDVVEVGAKVTDVKVGDRVWAYGRVPCFECEWCKRKEYLQCPNLKYSGIMANGGFAEYVWHPFIGLNEIVIKLPDTMSYQDGALIEPISVGAGAAKDAEPKTGDVVVVLGAGSVGLGAVAKAKALGVSKVIASEVSAKRLKAAKELGADVVINPAEEDAVKRVMKETSGKGADIVIEAAGKPVTFIQSIEMARAFGKVMLVALYEQSFEFNPSPAIWKRVRMQPAPWPQDFSGAFELIKAGKVKDKQVVSHTFPLDKINEAFEAQRNAKESIKVMIEP